MASEVLQKLRDANVDAAFACRRELISIKKLLLHQFASGRSVSTDAARAVTYFWFSDFKSAQEASAAASNAAPPAGAGADFPALLTTAVAATTSTTTAAAVLATVVEGKESKTSWAQTPRYSALASRLSKVKAATHAMHDLRDATKRICGQPRHPDDAPSNNSFLLPRVDKLIKDATRAVGANADGGADAGGGGRARANVPEDAAQETAAVASERTSSASARAMSECVKGTGIQLFTSTTPAADTTHAQNTTHAITAATLNCDPPPPPPQTRLTVPREHRALHCSLIARGAYKAVSMRADAAAAATVLEARANMMARLASLLKRRQEAGVVGVEGVGDTQMPHVNNRDRAEVTQLIAALEAMEPLLADTAKLLRGAIAATASSARSVVCGDRDASSGTIPLFLADAPKSLLNCFGQHDSTSQQQELVRDAVVEMNAGIRKNGVPPAPASKSKCYRCKQTTAKVWLTDGVCFACELAGLDRGLCPRGGPACRPAAMCQHQHRCLACDPRFEPCLNQACRVERGDGEAAAERVEALLTDGAGSAASVHTNTTGGGGGSSSNGGSGSSSSGGSKFGRAGLVFLDFDRTLCSTRSGSSPLKGKGTHSLDPALRSLIASQSARCHIVTRNPNISDIASFLKMSGLPSIGGMHHVAKGNSKTNVMLGILGDQRQLDAGAVCRHVFVDDDVRELLDARLPASGIHRILMCRTKAL